MAKPADAWSCAACVPPAAAAAPPASRLQAFLGKEWRSGQPGLIMAVAVAAGELRGELELDGLGAVQLPPVQPAPVTIILLEAKRNEEGRQAPVGLPGVLFCAGVGFYAY